MDDVTASPAHARPKDYLWVLAVIAVCALIKVSPSWVGIAAAAGFPRFGRLPTDWTLAVIMEAYWAYALYAWLAAAAGLRSRRFAMWSAAGVFTLSLAGQSSARLVGVKVMTAFANGMPVIVLALIAVLVHLRQLDRADTAKAEEALRDAERETAQASAEAERIAELEAALEDALTAKEPLRAELETARSELARVTAKAEAAAAKLEAMSAQRKRKRTAQQSAKSAQAEDITTEFRALDEFQKDPELRKPRMGGELARRLGVSAATGRRLHTKLTAQDRSGESLTDRSAGTEDERSGERS